MDNKDIKESIDTKDIKDGPEKDEAITIKLIDHDGTQVTFRLKRTTKMKKVFENYAKRTGKDMASLRFLLDGERIDADKTPEDLDIDDMDQIDVALEQVGGN